VDYGVVPDLRDRFVVGSSSTKAVGSTGGSASITTSGDGDHVHTIDSTVLTVGQLPAHLHEVGYTGSGAQSSSDDNPDFIRSFDAGIGNVDTSSVGAGEGHTHTEQPSSTHTHTVAMTPPYYALAYIIKVTEYTEPV
jgi:hypothetical protein